MAKLEYNDDGRLLFTEEMKKEYTVLVPQMAPFHFDLLVETLRLEGFNTQLLDNVNKNVIKEGVKYVHNDSCYPALLVIGQLLDAIKNTDLDPHKVAVLITQTGGGCRASNYIHLLRTALKRSGLEFIPVISFNISKLESNPGFKLQNSFWLKAIWSVLFGDCMLQLHNEIVPYEDHKGDTEAMVVKWKARIIEEFRQHTWIYPRRVRKVVAEMVADFATIPKTKRDIPKVGIVGEIYVKFSSLGNNNLEDYLREADVEIIVPPLMDFILFKMDYRALEVEWYGGKAIKQHGINIAMWYIEKQRDAMRKAMKKHGFSVPIHFDDLRSLVDGIVSRGNRMGEGWLLTAEMMELIEHGAPNIVCTQPFGCLPNHISGKGMLKVLKEKYPTANIVPIDYDPGTSEVNQRNRITLMLANARGMIKPMSKDIAE